MNNLIIPLSVPKEKRAEYEKNWQQLTKGTNNLLLIAGDQKLEHLNDDFYGSQISPEDAEPEHLFRIASASSGAALATHLGLIARYGQNYKSVPYVVKINGKTNLGSNEDKDSSKPLWKVKDVLEFKKQSALKIVAIGYTIYLGGKYEGKMLKEAARAIFQAHQAGLLAILWMYPRAKNINENDIHIIAGAAGVAACLNADFAKVKYPYEIKNKKLAAKAFQEASKAAGKTRLLCVGGKKQTPNSLFNFLDLQLSISGSAGLAIGRNLHQRSLDEATRLVNALSAMIYNQASTSDAQNIYNKSLKISTSKISNKKLLGLF